MRSTRAGLLVGSALGGAGSVFARGTSPAERVVEEATPDAGATLSITCEIGLQALDPLNFAETL